MPVDAIVQTHSRLSPVEFFDPVVNRIDDFCPVPEAVLEVAADLDGMVGSPAMGRYWIWLMAPEPIDQSEVRIEPTMILLRIGSRTWRVISYRPAPPVRRMCRRCGCTQDVGCPGGCSWIEDDLCSQCA